MITKISVFCQKMPEKTVVKDAYSPKKINKAVIWDKKQTFINQVKIFKLNFLSFPLTKLENLSVHQIGNFLNFLKHPILFLIVSFVRKL